jgi:tetratricopeptide (TPR) repeat protein
MRRDWNWTAAEKEFRKALDLDPHFAAAHSAWSTLLTSLARHDEAIKEMQRACELDPQSGNHRSDLAWTYYCARRNREAIENSKIALLLDAASDVAHRQLEKEYVQAGQYDLAIDEYHRAHDSKNQQASGSVADLALIYAYAGRKAEAEQIYRNLQQLPHPETISNYSYVLAKLAAHLGHIDESLTYLKKAQQQRLARAIWMGVDPELDPLRRDPRFIQMLKEAKLR